ncbi:hypothetical protein BDR06DRAFT_488917 [Suillus hirtellus]|nr:hypothetical protein BDR06DRAFT_488917 [Suillus hirtellus]
MYVSPPNLRVCWLSDSSADMYQTCPELSMNKQAPAARYIVIYLSTNERGQRSSSANTQYLLVRYSLLHTQDHHLPWGELQTYRSCRSSREITHSRGCLTSRHALVCSQTFQVSIIQKIISISPPSTEISGIAAFQLDSSYFYQGFRCSTSFIV